MKKLFGFLYASMFLGLVAGTFYVLFQITPFIVGGFGLLLVLSGLRHGLKWKNWLTEWADNLITSIDKTWQVLFSPLLNLGVTTEHRFGDHKETASSVVGKNLRDTGLFRWKFIEKILSTLLEGGRPHSIKSIRED